MEGSLFTQNDTGSTNIPLNSIVFFSCKAKAK